MVTFKDFFFFLNCSRVGKAQGRRCLCSDRHLWSVPLSQELASPRGGAFGSWDQAPSLPPASLHWRSLPASLSVPLEAQAPSLESRSLPFPGAVGSKQQSPQKRRWLCPFSRPPSRRESRGGAQDASAKGLPLLSRSSSGEEQESWAGCLYLNRPPLPHSCLPEKQPPGESGGGWELQG